MKQIPYGIDNFEKIIRDNYYFIDKSKYIQTVEEQNAYILFVRPRRMGKSLFINMMMAYYDINKKGQFDELFGNLWIGKHPTKEANKYIVLKFDFSHIEYDITLLADNFKNYCINRINNLFDRYKDIFTEEERRSVVSQPNVKDAINNLIEYCRLKNLPTYLFIDEYDNFSNLVLSARGVKAHEAITHGEGFYRDFFKACKGTFDRVYMSGVTPVTYDDLTSGFNIADVVALLPWFDKLIGVTETELREMIEYYRSEGKITLSTDSIIAEMKPWYNNFYFSDSCYGEEPPVYNTDMVLRYMNYMIKSGQAPKEMLDTNARTDYKKLDYLVMAEDLDNRERRMEIVKDICARGYTVGDVHDQFPASRCGDEVNFKSMLYYFGTLTFGGWNEEGETILKVPNKTMGELYLQYMQQVISQEGLDITELIRHSLQLSISDAAIRHDWKPLTETIDYLYHNYSSLRNTIRGEADIQGFLRGLLCLNRYYDIWPELELGGGYCDILLVPKSAPRCPTKFSYLIEIKYMKAGDTDVDTYIREACSQLDRYVADAHLDNSPILNNTPLTLLYFIFQGTHLINSGQHA